MVKIVYKFNGEKKESLLFRFYRYIFLIDTVPMIKYPLSIDLRIQIFL